MLNYEVNNWHDFSVLNFILTFNFGDYNVQVDGSCSPLTEPVRLPFRFPVFMLCYAMLNAFAAATHDSVINGLWQERKFIFCNKGRKEGFF